MGTADIYHELFQTCYSKAKEAQDNGKLAEAVSLYRQAGEACLKQAKTVSGAMKKKLVERADSMERIADQLEEDWSSQKKDSGQKSGIPNSEKTNAASVSQEGMQWHKEPKTGIRFSDIAGLQDVKDSINMRVIMPRLHPQLYDAFHLKMKGGILLYGPPGTGKTMIAKAIAGEVDSAFYSIRCSSIVGKYFGESEKNIRSLFETARNEPSAIIFFDEFEALASQRGTDSTVMNRLVPELLSQMDGFGTDENGNVMVLAATNRPWDLDSAFLRPPRLTEKIYVGLPDLDARRFLIDRALGSDPVEETAVEAVRSLSGRTEGYNSADVVNLCNHIKMLAVRRSIGHQTVTPIRIEDVEQALAAVRSSVRKEDLEALRRWRETMEA